MAGAGSSFQISRWSSSEAARWTSAGSLLVPVSGSSHPSLKRFLLDCIRSAEDKQNCSVPAGSPSIPDKRLIHSEAASSSSLSWTAAMRCGNAAEFILIFRWFACWGWCFLFKIKIFNGNFDWLNWIQRFWLFIVCGLKHATRLQMF